MKQGAIALNLFLASLTVSSSAWAFAPAERDLSGRLEVAAGAQPRIERSVGFSAPDGHEAWLRLEKAMPGARWRAQWDLDTGVPQRIWGRGLEAPGSIRSGEIAERIARDHLARAIELLAPGAKASDFVLSANQLDRGLRTVAFIQTHEGLEVLGGQVSFRFKRDRLFVMASEALPHVRLPGGEAAVSDEIARRSAEDWIKGSFGSEVRSEPIKGPLVLPLVRSRDIEYRRAVEVVVHELDRAGRWSVYVDAETGAPIARRQTLMFSSGTLLYDVPQRRPGGGRAALPAPGVRVNIDGVAAESAADGTISWPIGDATEITAGVVGPLVRVINDAGSPASARFSLEDGGSFTWSMASDELLDAQITTFISSQVVKARAKQIAPNLRYLATQLQATVNLPDSCNAFSDGTTINFFRAGRGCENTGRLPDVVYHEYGHAIHANAIIRGAGSFDTSLSEGASDYIAATITGDPGMGRGFFGDNRALRQIDPQTREHRWPEDITRDPHSTGLIFAGAIWDLRKSLVMKLGDGPGVAASDSLWFQVLQRSSDIPSTYVEIIAADDDDGDLSNGTPNICEINAAFVLHGLSEQSAVGPAIGSVELDGLVARLPVTGGALCPGNEITGAALTWELRGQPGSGGTVAMDADSGSFVARIPPQEEGSVVRYKVELSSASGERISLPDNPADPMYEVFIGRVTPIYCTDFASDPFLDGWSHRLVSGQAREGADDWQWGTPAGANGSGDPSGARSGAQAVGNDLGAGNYDGKYQAGKVNELLSPEIDVSGHRNVRIQYWRWLNVEDGFFDQARILANDQTVWSNLATNAQGTTHHTDKEWRFHDVDVSDIAVADGKLRVAFRIASDAGLEMGGWTIDDFCVVSWDPESECTDDCMPMPDPICGDAIVHEGEICDDGNDVNGDGCNADCTVPAPVAICGDAIIQDGEQCDDGNAVAGDGCNPDCTAVVETCEDCGPAAEPTTIGGNEPACGCTTAGRHDANAPIAAWLIAAVLLWARRKRP